MAFIARIALRPMQSSLTRRPFSLQVEIAPGRSRTTRTPCPPSTSPRSSARPTAAASARPSPAGTLNAFNAVHRDARTPEGSCSPNDDGNVI